MNIGRQSKLTGPSNTIWISRIFGRKLHNAPEDQLSPSDGDLVDFADHVGDWCGSVPEATLITSRVDFKNYFAPMYETYHAPVLDLDVDHLYYPSTTPGHGALLLNVTLSEEDYLELLDVLERCGIVQHGFAEASRQRGYSAVRTPWTDKLPKAD